MTIASTYVAADDVAIRERTDGLVRFAVWLTLGMLALRLVMATQVQLFFDEAYYWLWSQQLQGSYYDHPPMVALFIKAGTFLFGDTELGVRFFGNVAAALDAVLVFAIVRALTDNLRTAAWATILFNAAILFGAFGFFMAPDQPMILFWLAGLYGMVRIAKGGPAAWWLWVGAMGGLATISKFSTFFLALSVPLWLLIVPQLREWFRRPWIYAGALVAVLVCAPVLLWNAQHDWISFTFQFTRAGLQYADPRPWSVGVYVLVVLILATPPTVILAAFGLRTIAARGWRRDPARALLLITPIPLALYLAYLALWEQVGPHWVAPLVVFIAIWAAYGTERMGRGFWSGLRRISGKVAVPFGIGVTLLFYVGLVETVLPLPPDGDPLARFRGSDRWAADIAELRAEYGAAYILTPSYTGPGLLRFHLGASTLAYQLGDFGRWSYFDGAGTPDRALMAMTALFVGEGHPAHEAATLSRYFRSVLEVGAAFRPTRRGQGDTDTVWLVSDPKPAAMALFGLTPEDAPAPLEDAPLEAAAAAE